MMDIQAIRDALPHRYPMLLVDRVLEVSEDEITAIKNVSINVPNNTEATIKKIANLLFEINLISSCILQLF